MIAFAEQRGDSSEAMQECLRNHSSARGIAEILPGTVFSYSEENAVPAARVMIPVWNLLGSACGSAN